MQNATLVDSSTAVNNSTKYNICQLTAREAFWDFLVIKGNIKKFDLTWIDSHQACQLPCSPFSKPAPFLLGPGNYYKLAVLFASRSNRLQYFLHIIKLEMRRQKPSAHIRYNYSIWLVELDFRWFFDM